jgi:CO/xanthine dehydrogenase FAD-binding subunit
VSFTIITPATPAEAVQLLHDAPAGSLLPIAGGTDLLLDIEDGRATPSRLLSLRLLAWDQLQWSESSLKIGSTLPLRRLDSERRLAVQLPALAQAVHAVGSVALRHRATLGGNLGRASPASDLIPVLLVLEAKVHLVGPQGRRELPVERFVRASRSTALDPDELIESVEVPASAPSEYVWQRVRPANDISQVGVAVAFLEHRNQWRIAVGGVPPAPRRVPEAETDLSGPVPNDASIQEAAEHAALRAPFVTDRRATEAYRRRLVAVLVRRAVRAVIDRRGANPTVPGGAAS